MKNIKKNLSRIFAGGFLLMMLFAPMVQVHALDSDSLWGGYEAQFQSTTELGNTDPRVMVASVIKILLGFLGVIAVLLILYAGFLWMTAGGSDENVTKAKSILSSAVIGLIIILAAYGITQFVLTALTNIMG